MGNDKAMRVFAFVPVETTKMRVVVNKGAATGVVSWRSKPSAAQGSSQQTTTLISFSLFTIDNREKGIKLVMI